MVSTTQFFNRDLSWLSFNERVLSEAGRRSVPLMERFRFLAIYSSNLDEFYRVRIPFYTRKKATEDDLETLEKIKSIINRDQNIYGNLIREQLIPELEERGYSLLYDSVIPVELNEKVVLVMMDSQWFLNIHDKPGPESSCEARSIDEFAAELKQIVASHPNQLLVLVMHHPMYTYGVHG
ncbi:MAG: hypothetical protein EOP49_44770, partial [Sphingobacteriales bacterium]